MFTQNTGVTKRQSQQNCAEKFSKKPTVKVAETLYVIGGRKNTETQRDIAR